MSLALARNCLMAALRSMAGSPVQSAIAIGSLALGLWAAILAGVDTIEHVSLVDDEGIKLALQKGTYFGMDIYNTDYTQAEGKKNGVLEANLQKDRDIGEIQRQNFRKALKAGVKMIYSTDAGVYPHGDNARQFAVMVRYGATPLQAIQTATVTAAQALVRRKDEVGEADRDAPPPAEDQPDRHERKGRCDHEDQRVEDLLELRDAEGELAQRGDESLERQPRCDHVHAHRPARVVRLHPGIGEH